ncbi:hypothetical protein BVC80_1745g34 [Macleaya cordata]|uniref:DUF7722 domain-containing protein n=1 Tax=Macleaya cordata TaxID=56857 RepID=A0A200QKM2_MACCD|nr:hypothetical protein BVC80_1745g34 [Macleaya cordata]
MSGVGGGGTESVTGHLHVGGREMDHHQRQLQSSSKEIRCGGGRGGYFQMPLHYPRYTKANYETMPEWRIDLLLREYGLPVMGDIDQKRKFAMGAFLWL